MQNRGMQVARVVARPDSLEAQFICLANDLAALRTAILEGQQKNAEASTYLEQLAGNEGANIDAKIAVLRNKLSNGQADDAVTYAAKLVSDDPNNLDLQYINASVLAAAGQPAEAEA